VGSVVGAKVNRPDEFLGHPKALVTIATTEFFDRMSFHGLQALLVLYLVGYLFLPENAGGVVGFETVRATIESVTGPLSIQALASQIFGLYMAGVTFMPLVGGYLGDRVLGRTGGVVLGALLMTFGHLCMAFDASFFAALTLLVLGAGFLRGNLLPQVGDLYDQSDPRRANGYQIYGAMVNIGAFTAPLLAGGIAQFYGWHAGFSFAAIGMMTGLGIYLFGVSRLPSATRTLSQAARAPLTKSEWERVFLLLGMIPIVALFWVAQSQIWNSYNLWVRDHVQLMIGSFQMPIPWLQALDGIAPLFSMPAVLWWWHRQSVRGREQDEFHKISTGCAIFAAGVLILAAGQYVTDETGRTPVLWAVAFHVISNIGWVFFSPTMWSIFSRAAPRKINATMLGAYIVSISIGSVISGRLGGFYETMSPDLFWGMHAAIVGFGGLAAWVYGRAFKARLFAQG
jgi:POT family proton-dependent oligopeptide transporter